MTKLKSDLKRFMIPKIEDESQKNFVELKNFDKMLDKFNKQGDGFGKPKILA